MSQSPAVLKEPAVGWRLQKTSGRLTFSFLWKAFISSYWNSASLMINSEVKGRTSLCRLKRFKVPICDHRHVNVKVLKLSCINRNIFRLKCQLWLSFNIDENIDEIKMSQFCDFNIWKWHNYELKSKCWDCSRLPVKCQDWNTHKFKCDFKYFDFICCILSSKVCLRLWNVFYLLDNRT